MKGNQGERIKIRGAFSRRWKLKASSYNVRESLWKRL